MGASAVCSTLPNVEKPSSSADRRGRCRTTRSPWVVNEQYRARCLQAEGPSTERPPIPPVRQVFPLKAQLTAVLYPRSSSQYPSGSHSRQPSFYASYPVGTPSTGSHEHSPPVHPATTPLATSGSSSSENSPPLSGVNTPAVKPALAPINTSLHRDSSGSSDGHPLPRQTSVDRLRQEAGSGSTRAPSPAFSGSGHERNPSESGSSRATSPRPSLYGGMPSPARQSFSSSLAPGNQHRPYSMHSLNSAAGGSRIGGAPHQRHVQLEMPRLLGARPDSNGDFFGGMPISRDSMHWGTLDGHVRRPSRAAQELGGLLKTSSQIELTK